MITNASGGSILDAAPSDCFGAWADIAAGAAEGPQW